MFPERPYFSIVIPTYNRPDQLAACLQAITCLDYPRDRFEVIVVDDGGKTSLENVVSPYREELDLTLITQANAGPAAARNAGAVKAKGEYLAFTDDDCKPEPAWLEALSLRFSSTPDVAVGGRILNTLPENIYSTATDLLIKYLYENLNHDPNQAQFFTSNNLVLPRDKFMKMGRFDTTFPRAAGEDRELCDRWLYHGYTLTYVPEAVIHHSHNMTFSSFWKQHFNYGCGSYHFHRLREKRNQEPARIEAPRYYLNLVRFPLSKPSDHPTLLLVLLLGVSQAANALGFFLERVRKNTRA